VPIDVAKVTAQVDGLIAEYEALRQQSKFDDLSVLKEQLAALGVRCRPALIGSHQPEAATPERHHVMVPCELTHALSEPDRRPACAEGRR